MLPFSRIIATSLASQKEIAAPAAGADSPPPTLESLRDDLQGGVGPETIVVSGGVTIAGTDLQELRRDALLAYAMREAGKGGRPGRCC